MSVDDRVSDAIGSAGTGTGSRTGSGGAGGREPPVEVTGGGAGIGRVTGGFFLPPHALTASIATIATTTTVRLCFIVSASRSFSFRFRLHFSLLARGRRCAALPSNLRNESREGCP